MNRWVAILITIVVCCSPAIDAVLNQKNATSFEILTYLKKWGSLMVSPVGGSNERKLITLDQKSLRFISPYAREYKELDQREPSKSLTDHGPQMKTYLYGAAGKETWTNRPGNYYISATRDLEFNWNFLAWDGQIVYQAWLVNPKLSFADNGARASTDYYMPWNDGSNCPLKVMAYHILRKAEAGCCVGLIVKNTTNTEITNLAGSIELYDGKNKPVMLPNGVNPSAVNRPVAIPALSPYLAIEFWSTDQPIDFRVIKPAITGLQFKDGTIWGKHE